MSKIAYRSWSFPTNDPGPINDVYHCEVAVDESVHYLRNVGKNGYLDIYYGSYFENAVPHVYTPNYTAAQRFVFEKQYSKTYSIRPLNSHSLENNRTNELICKYLEKSYSFYGNENLITNVPYSSASPLNQTEQLMYEDILESDNSINNQALVMLVDENGIRHHYSISFPKDDKNLSISSFTVRDLDNSRIVDSANFNEYLFKEMIRD